MAAAAQGAISPRRTRFWQEGETALMIRTLLEQDAGRKVMGGANVEGQADFERVSTVMETAGYRRTPAQCRRKLRREKEWFYETMEDWAGPPPLERQTPRFRRLLKLWRQGGRQSWLENKPQGTPRRKRARRARVLTVEDSPSTSTSSESAEEPGPSNVTDQDEAAAECSAEVGGGEGGPVLISSAAETGEEAVFECEGPSVPRVPPWDVAEVRRELETINATLSRIDRTLSQHANRMTNIEGALRTIQEQHLAQRRKEMRVVWAEADTETEDVENEGVDRGQVVADAGLKD